MQVYKKKKKKVFFFFQGITFLLIWETKTYHKMVCYADLLYKRWIKLDCFIKWEIWRCMQIWQIFKIWMSFGLLRFFKFFGMGAFKIFLDVYNLITVMWKYVLTDKNCFSVFLFFFFFFKSLQNLDYSDYLKK